MEVELPIVVVQTVDRPEPNLRTTIDSMLCDPLMESIPDLVFCVGDDNWDYAIEVANGWRLELPFLPEGKKLEPTVHRPVGVEWSHKKDWPPIRRGTSCYADCMYHGALLAKKWKRDVLIVQDDIEFAPGWLATMLERSKQMRVVRGNAFILSGFLPYHRPAGALVDYPCDKFYGAQCLWWPKEVLLDLGAADAMRSNALAEDLSGNWTGMPDDLFIGKWCAENGVSIYATLPSVVQHLGNAPGKSMLEHRNECYAPQYAGSGR